MRSVWLAAIIVPWLFAAAHAETLNAASWRFSVTFPCQSTVGGQTIKTAGGDLLLTYFTCENDTQAFIVALNDNPTGTMTPNTVNGAYAGAVNGAAKTDNDIVRSVVPYTLGDVTGREAIFDSQDGKQVKRMRLFIVGDRLYQVLYLGPAGSEAERTCKEFLESFVLIGIKKP